jgi:hypothetical protein
MDVPLERGRLARFLWIETSVRARRPRSTFKFLVPLLSLSLLAAKKIDYVQNCLKDAGGVEHFERVETVDWTFLIARPSEKGVIKWHGRQRMQRLGPEFLIREDVETPEGVWTIFVGSDCWVQKDGFLVTDKTVFDARVADTRARAFCLLAPFTFLDKSTGGDYLGSAYFQSRLLRRVRVDPKGFSPIPGPLVLQLDPETSRLNGLVFEKGGEGLLMEDPEMHQNLLRSPGQWTWYNAEGKRTEILRANSVVFNSYIGENVFKATAHVSQGEPRQ